MTLDELPPTVRRTIERVALACEVEPESALTPASSPQHVARQRAIQALAEMKIGGKYRYSINELRQWFGLSRPWINAIRARSKTYQKRANRPTSAQAALQSRSQA